MRLTIPAHIFLLNFLLVALFCQAPQNLSAQNSDAMLSFKGFELGVQYDSLTIDQHKSLMKRGKYQKLIRYDLLEDYLLHEGLQLRFVRLFFWKGYLHSIDVKSQSGQGDALKAWVEKIHGEGIKEDAMGYKFLWEYPGYRVFLEQNLVTKDVTITFLQDEVHNSYYKFMYERSYGN